MTLGIFLSSKIEFDIFRAVYSESFDITPIPNTKVSEIPYRLEHIKKHDFQNCWLMTLFIVEIYCAGVIFLKMICCDINQLSAPEKEVVLDKEMPHQ